MLMDGFARVVRLRLWRHPAVLPVLAGLCVLLLYGAVDFPFHNPAVALNAAAFFPLLLRWGELEAGRKVKARPLPDGSEPLEV